MATTTPAAARCSAIPPARPPHRRREVGAATAELVVATPLMLFLLLVVVQFGVWLHAVHIAQAGADQALTAARAQGGSLAAGQAQANTVLAQLAGGILTGPSVGVVAVVGPGGQPQIRVDVTGSAGSVVPLLHLPVHVVAQGPRETWTTPNGTTP
jgi:Flp pilus assembly protein TadG